MNRIHCRAASCCAWVVSAALVVLVCPGATSGQSPVVFATIETLAPKDFLVRFDSGVETFAATVGSFPAFIGVTILNRQVLVADFSANAIQKFSPDGVYLGQFAVLNKSPTFLESDRSGNVYTTHWVLGSGAVRYNSSGVVTGTFGSGFQLAGIDADAAGNVYAVNGGSTDSNTLYKFAPDGTLLNSIVVAARARDLAIDEVGNRLFIADNTGGTAAIKIFDISGATPSLLGSMVTPADSNFTGVHFAAESGNILVTHFRMPNNNDPRGLEFSPSGTLLREYRPANVDIIWDITTFVVPEPASLVLLLVALMGLTARRPRRTCASTRANHASRQDVAGRELNRPSASSGLAPRP